MSFVWTSVKPWVWSPQQPSLKLEKDAFDGWTLRWIRNWLDGHMHRVLANVWMEISDEWCQKVSTETSSVYYMHWCNMQWSTLSKLSNTKLSSDTSKGWNAIQRHLEKPGECASWEMHEGVQQGQMQGPAPGSEQPLLSIQQINRLREALMRRTWRVWWMKNWT